MATFDELPVGPTWELRDVEVGKVWKRYWVKRFGNWTMRFEADGADMQWKHAHDREWKTRSVHATCTQRERCIWLETQVLDEAAGALELARLDFDAAVANRMEK